LPDFSHNDFTFTYVFVSTMVHTFVCGFFICYRRGNVCLKWQLADFGVGKLWKRHRKSNSGMDKRVSNSTCFLGAAIFSGSLS